MNPNKYFEFEYNGELYVVPREWLDEHNKQIRAEVLEEILEMDKYECTKELCYMMNSELSCASCFAYQLLEQKRS